MVASGDDMTTKSGDRGDQSGAGQRPVELYPAIDLRDGQVVRLTKGDYDMQVTYGTDPVAVAEEFARAGATWIHVVDLDAARSGDPVNRPIVAKIAAAVAGSARVQTGGGVRSVADAEALAAAGVARVVMGSAAVADPSLVDLASQVLAVAVGLDHREGDLAVHGWTEQSGLSVIEALQMFPSAEAFVITDISRDGMLQGPDVAGLAAAVMASSIPVIASGGVSGLQDVLDLAEIADLGGIIIGKAIYEGRLNLSEAVRSLATRAQIGGSR
jgi:phosphoribosylformimino-5-aminoimidazole carboxamide ribotide isomerase